MLTDRTRLTLVNGDERARGPRKGTGRRSTGEVAGLSVHARVSVAAGDKAGRERLARYCARPPFAQSQLSAAADGRIVFTPTRRKRDAPAVLLEPLAFLRRVAALIPPPSQHQLRYAGVLAPAAKLRGEVVPRPALELRPTPMAAPPLRIDDAPSMSAPAARARWARLIHRVYGADALLCPRCGGRLHPIAQIRDPLSIRRILEHLRAEPAQRATARAPP